MAKVRTNNNNNLMQKDGEKVFKQTEKSLENTMKLIKLFGK